MRFFWQVSLCCLLAGGVALAQRGGAVGGGMRGGIGAGPYGGGFGMGGGVFTGGFTGGGFNGGVFTGGGFTGSGSNLFTGGYNLGRIINRPGQIQAIPFRGRDFDFDDRFGRGFFNNFSGNGFYGYGYYPFGYGYPYYWPDYAYSSYFPGYDYPYNVSGYSTYQASPNVTVLMPTQSTVPPLSNERARPVMREYDQNGLEIRPGGSLLYLIAFKDHSIVAATTYRVEGSTLRYTTQQNENKDASLDTVDRALSLQLNRERNVRFDLPPQ